MPSPLSPEIEPIVQALTHLAPSRTAFRAFEEPERQRLRDLAGYHGVAAFLPDGLSSRGIAVAGLALAAELARISEDLTAKSLRHLALKGPTLAVLAHENLGRRTSGDLDLLVDPGDADRAKAILTGLGYEARWPARSGEERAIRSSYEEEILRDLETGGVVDLHWRLTPRWLDPIGTFDELWERRQWVPLAGAAVPTLGTDDLLLYLLVHGTKHFWRRLLWIVDVDRLVRRNPRANWQSLVSRAEARGLDRMVFIGALVARRLLGTPIPGFVLDRAEADARAVRMAESTFPRLGKRQGEDLTKREELLYAWEAAPRWRDRGRGLARYLFAPSFREIERTRLPRHLYHAYVPLRVVRLSRRAAEIATRRLLR